MKAVIMLLAAMSPLLTCSDGATSGNEAQAEANNLVESAAANNEAAPPSFGNESVNAAGDTGNGGANASRDVPIKGGQSRPAGPPDADEADQCGASRYQGLVGRPRSAIPPQPAGARWRVTCTGCPITMDYSPARLNIFYNSETERVEEVRCG